MLERAEQSLIEVFDVTPIEKHTEYRPLPGSTPPAFAAHEKGAVLHVTFGGEVRHITVSRERGRAEEARLAARTAGRGWR